MSGSERIWQTRPHATWETTVTMKPIEQDLPGRQPVWGALQMLFMDTDQEYELPRIARVCAESPYTLDELHTILFAEVFPACRINMFLWVGGEWCGFEMDWLTDRILLKHRHGKRPLLWVGRMCTAYWWKRLRPKILELRESGGS